MIKKVKNRLPSLRKILVIVFTTSWLIPIAVFSFFIFNSYQEAYIEKIEGLFLNGINVSGVLVNRKIEDCIVEMQKPTYEGKWEEIYNEFEKEKISEGVYIAGIRNSLKSKFSMDDRVKTYAFYMVEEETPSCFSMKSVDNYEIYEKKVQPVVNPIREEDNNYIQLRIVDNTLYLIRNLYTVNRYRKYGTLVIGLDTNQLLAEMPLEKIENVLIYIDGQKEFLSKHGLKEPPHAKALYEKLMSTTLTNKDVVYRYGLDGFSGYVYQNNYDNYHLSLLYTISQKELYSSLEKLNKILLTILAMLVPFVIGSYFFLIKHIEVPLRRLVRASKYIGEGNFGTVIDGKRMPNEEFDSLVVSINSMSIQVKHLFDSVYNEKIARRDAQIAALQAQINPHFLNNTLEMMNWQARMNGDIETSKMIEALGVVLDSSMNRSNAKFVYLSEELHCADSYLYIMSMRFGQRLKVEKQIDAKLLQTKVPQLILQPLLENAIKHGIEKVKSGTIFLNISHDEKLLFIDVINTGKTITTSGQAKIDQVLAGTLKKDKLNPSRYTSIGIYNVNKRIKLMYGMEYGLTVTSMDQKRTLSRIILPYKN